MKWKCWRMNNGYELIEPQADWCRELGFVMVCNPKGEILKFFDNSHLENANKYMDYVSLSKWEKMKYWLNHKRGE